VSAAVPVCFFLLRLYLLRVHHVLIIYFLASRFNVVCIFICFIADCEGMPKFIGRFTRMATDALRAAGEELRRLGYLPEPPAEEVHIFKHRFYFVLHIFYAAKLHNSAFLHRSLCVCWNR